MRGSRNHQQNKDPTQTPTHIHNGGESTNQETAFINICARNTSLKRPLSGGSYRSELRSCHMLLNWLNLPLNPCIVV